MRRKSRGLARIETEFDSIFTNKLSIVVAPLTQTSLSFQTLVSRIKVALDSNPFCYEHKGNKGALTRN